MIMKVMKTVAIIMIITETMEMRTAVIVMRRKIVMRRRTMITIIPTQMRTATTMVVITTLITIIIVIIVMTIIITIITRVITELLNVKLPLPNKGRICIVVRVWNGMYLKNVRHNSKVNMLYSILCLYTRAVLRARTQPHTYNRQTKKREGDMYINCYYAYIVLHICIYSSYIYNIYATQ